MFAIILLKGASTSVAVAATTSKLFGVAAHALQSGSCRICRTVNWGFTCVQMPFQACTHFGRSALCNASPFPRVRLERFSAANKVGQFREGRANNARDDGKFVARPPFVERTVVRRCPGASGCEAAPMMSFRQWCISWNCSSRVAGCGFHRCCAVLSERLDHHDVCGCAGPTNLLSWNRLLAPTVSMHERNAPRYNARDQTLHQARHRR